MEISSRKHIGTRSMNVYLPPYDPTCRLSCLVWGLCLQPGLRWASPEGRTHGHGTTAESSRSIPLVCAGCALCGGEDADVDRAGDAWSLGKRFQGFQGWWMSEYLQGYPMFPLEDKLVLEWWRYRGLVRSPLSWYRVLVEIFILKVERPYPKDRPSVCGAEGPILLAFFGWGRTIFQAIAKV